MQKHHPEIQVLTTPGGVTVWLMESHELPMVSVDVSVRGGSVFEPAGKEGLAQMTARLLDEGAGELKAKAYKDALEGIGARLSADADSQDITLRLMTLQEHAGRAFELLGMALCVPRFDVDALKRVREGMLADIRQGDEDPATVAWRLFRPAVYGGHVYGNSGEGTLESVGKLAENDVRAWHRDNFTKENMVVAVVGAIGAGEVMRLVDAATDGLFRGSGRAAVRQGPAATIPRIVRSPMDVPQGTVLMGHLGFSRDDPDYYALLVMNEILGGGVLTSRLGADVREKHGLAYDVRSVNSPLPHNGMFYVSFATDNAKVEMALSLVRKHLNLIRDELVPQDELDDAKAYLVGSFPLRTDSNAKLLNMLAMMQGEGLGTDYLERWPERIAAVSADDVQRVARRLIQPDGMVLTVVGRQPDEVAA